MFLFSAKISVLYLYGQIFWSIKLHKNFTKALQTSQKLHKNFTKTSQKLHMDFTKTSQMGDCECCNVLITSLL